MKCKLVYKLIDSYIDGELEGKQLKEFEKHIQHCDKCKIELNKSVKIKEILKLEKNENIQLPSNFHEELMQKVSKIDNKTINKTKKVFNYRLAIPAVACLLILVVYNVNNYDLINKKSNIENSQISNQNNQINNFTVPRSFSDESSSKFVNPKATRSSINLINQKDIVKLYELAIKKINQTEFNELNIQDTKMQINIDKCLNDEKLIKQLKDIINNEISNDKISYIMESENSTNMKEGTTRDMEIELIFQEPKSISDGKVELVVVINCTDFNKNITFIFQRQKNNWNIESINNKN